jgi:hypothetical protein
MKSGQSRELRPRINYLSTSHAMKEDVTLEK